MNRNDCEAVLYLHRMFRPRRRTGRGFLTGTVFLDAALLVSAFVLATSPFVRQPGILVDLPVSTQAEGILFHDMVLSIPRDGLKEFTDIVSPQGIVYGQGCNLRIKQIGRKIAVNRIFNVERLRIDHKSVAGNTDGDLRTELEQFR